MRLIPARPLCLAAGYGGTLSAHPREHEACLESRPGSRCASSLKTQQKSGDLAHSACIIVRQSAASRRQANFHLLSKLLRPYPVAPSRERGSKRAYTDRVAGAEGGRSLTGGLVETSECLAMTDCDTRVTSGEKFHATLVKGRLGIFPRVQGSRSEKGLRSTGYQKIFMHSVARYRQELINSYGGFRK